MKSPLIDMTQRPNQTLQYNPESQLTSVTGTPSATFVYDGDGNRVKTTINGITTAYVGNHTEWNVSIQEMTRYYLAGGQRIAFRVIKSGQADKVFYLLADHLGSTNVVMQVGGVFENKTYTAWGKDRTGNITKTDRQYTGQINESELGLYFYNARYYDPDLGRFTSADTIVPQPGNPSSYDRYSYVNNNPINNVDPTGHRACSGWDEYGNCVADNDWSQRGRRNVRSVIGNDDNLVQNQDFSSEPNIPESTSSLFGYQIDENQCELTSCSRAWETPWWWDTDPQNPDYFVFTLSGGKIAGVTILLVIDRYGSIYFGGGANIGKSITLLTGGVNGGWIGSGLDNDIPDQGNIGSFLTGLSVNGQIGALGDLAGTWSPHSNNYLSHFALEYGMVIPVVIGVSVVYNIKIIDGFKVFGRGRLRNPFSVN